MTKSAINDIVIQKLNEFETLENIHSPEGWNESLMNKLASANLRPASKFPSTGFSISALLIALVNICFILSTIINNSHQMYDKDRDLQVISEELLINPISIKE